MICFGFLRWTVISSNDDNFLFLSNFDPQDSEEGAHSRLVLALFPFHTQVIYEHSTNVRKKFLKNHTSEITQLFVTLLAHVFSFQIVFCGNTYACVHVCVYICKAIYEFINIFKRNTICNVNLKLSIAWRIFRKINTYVIILYCCMSLYHNLLTQVSNLGHLSCLQFLIF